MADDEFGTLAGRVAQAAQQVASAAAATAAAADPATTAQTGMNAAAAATSAHQYSIWDSLRSVAIAALVGLGFMLVNLYRNQNTLLYHPTVPQMPFKRVDETPGPFGSPADQAWGMAFEEHYLTTLDGVKIHAWWIPAPADVDPASAPTVVHFHANALHIGFRLGLANAMHKELRSNVLLMSYRGYGNSEGQPSERGLELDADAALSWLTSRPDVDKRKIFIHGTSLGGAVAIQAAATGNYAPNVAGVVLENTFTSIPALVDHIMPFLRIFKPLVLRIGWRSIDIIHRITCPMLFISGLKDELVPPVMMQQLHDAAVNVEKGDKEILPVPDGGHNDTQQKAGPAYWARFRAFMERAIRKRVGHAHTGDAASRKSTPDYQQQYKDTLARQTAVEASRQQSLVNRGSVGRFPGAVDMGEMPATAGPAVNLDLPPGGQAAATLAHVHLSSQGVDRLQEGAEDVLREAAEDAEDLAAAVREEAQWQAGSGAAVEGDPADVGGEDAGLRHRRGGAGKEEL